MISELCDRRARLRRRSTSSCHCCRQDTAGAETQGPFCQPLGLQMTLASKEAAQMLELPLWTDAEEADIDDVWGKDQADLSRSAGCHR